MTKEPVHKRWGTPLSKWINQIPNELEADAVGLWQVVYAGEDGFGLDREMLKDFVKEGIVALVKRGAVPVLPSSDPDKFWDRQDQYGHTSEEIAANIVNEWQRSGKEPDHDGLWFSIRPEAVVKKV